MTEQFQRRLAAARDRAAAEKQRAEVAEHRSGASEYAREMRDDERRCKSRRESFERVDEHDGQSEPPPVDTPHVRPADVAAADRSDVSVLDCAHQPVAGRNRPRQVANDYEERSAYVWIWYFDTQSLTVRQSRLSKNASM